MMKLYTKNTCDGCNATKELLQAHDVTFEEISLDENPHHWERFRELGMVQAPIVIAGDGAKQQMFCGYQPSAITRLIAELS